MCEASLGFGCPEPDRPQAPRVEAQRGRFVPGGGLAAGGDLGQVVDSSIVDLVMEGMPPGHRCRGMTRSGDRCRRSGDPYCYQHSASSLPSAVRDGDAARSLDRVVVETAWSRALSGVSLASIATAALPKIDTAAMAAAAMANIDTAAMAVAAMPRFDAAAMFAAAMPKFDTAAMFAAAMPKFDTAAMIAAAMPKFDTAAMIAAAMPKIDTAAMFAAAGAQVERLAKITASLGELDTDHWAEAFEALDKTVLEKAFSDDGRAARDLTVEGSMEPSALSTATAAGPGCCGGRPGDICWVARSCSDGRLGAHPLGRLRVLASIAAGARLC